jgi:purine nucleoside phosphorylase
VGVQKIRWNSGGTEPAGEWEYNETGYQLFVDFKNAYDSVKREILYNILIEFEVTRKLVSLIKMCLNEMYSKVSNR